MSRTRAAAPEAVEAISCGRPAFRLDRRYFVDFGVTRNGCSFLEPVNELPGRGRSALDSHGPAATL